MGEQEADGVPAAAGLISRYRSTWSPLAGDASALVRESIARKRNRTLPEFVMSFRIRGLSPEPFRHLFGLDDEALAAAGARRCVVDHAPGFPDRIELRDLAPGETALLLNYVHQPADTPFRASHAIFVREGATAAYEAVDRIPEVIRIRPISLRAFDAGHMMVDADLAEGAGLEGAIERLLAQPEVAYLHAHYAKRGCYAARIERA
jgi:hypothetical protein